MFNVKTSYNLALIGLGAWGRNYVSTIKSLPNVNLVAATRKTDARPDFLPVSCKFYTNYSKMLDENKLDGVIVVTSPFSHPFILSDLAYRGIPALVEKPVALTMKELNKALGVNKNMKLLVDYVHLFAPGFVEMANWAINNTKNIVKIETINTGAITDRGFSPFFDYGAHDVAMFLYMLKRDMRKYDIDIKSVQEIQKNLFNLQLTANTATNSIEISLVFGNDIKQSIFKFYTENRFFIEDELFVYDGSKPNQFIINEKIGHGESKNTPLHEVLLEFLRIIDECKNSDMWIDLTRETTNILERAFQTI